MNTSLQELVQYQAKTWTLKGVIALLGWDAKTYMPAGGISARSQHLSLMEGLVHERTTAAEYKKLLARLVDLVSSEILEPSLAPHEQRLVKESLRDYNLALALPNQFVQEFSQAATQAEHVWEQARAKDDFSLYAPYLGRMISLCKKKAEYLSLGKTPYDSLLNAYEPHATTDQLNQVFSQLKGETIRLLNHLPMAKPAPAYLTADYSHQKQMELAQQLMKKMGAQQENIRLDLSAHPFSTTLHCRDIRITTRFDGLSDFVSTILHETGHALYDAGLPEEWFGSPLCEPISMAIHESQSRFWEVFVGKSRAFWETQFAILQTAFPEQLQRVSLDEFYLAINSMGASPIRVHADELTYNLHIIIRFELEQLMINESVEVNDLPALWNEKYEKYLGITPKNNSEGILQDIHWAFGDIGYFPTYTLGNLYAAHWWQQIQKDLPGLHNSIRAHDFRPILKWLREKIHSVGRGQTSAELVRSVTGSDLSSQPLITFLEEKARDVS